ncbi:MAG TPA: hypothetical protein PKE61_01935 [Burkholderiaceae bacterium]|nr:hypothetical protein [Burkholderiaceae bacterium]HNG78298.1 hypothetical protein [Burkholderiaceae bacterium]
MGTASTRIAAVRHRGAVGPALPVTVLLCAACWLHPCAEAAGPASGVAKSVPPASARLDPELLQDLMGWAVRLTGLPAPAVLPRLTPLPEAALAARVCPDQPRHCRTLMAVYDTDRQEVLYRDSLDLRDETDQSFVVHEFIHHLQHLRDGDALFADCPRVVAAETQAYAAQNRYLAHFRQWRRVGEMLRFMHCHSAATEPEVRPGGPAALTSRSPQGR